LIDGVNDQDRHAEQLVDFLRPFRDRAKVNIIPCNPTDGADFVPSPEARCLEFQRIVTEGGWRTFIRTPRGRLEDAACGQLATQDRRARRTAVSPSGAG
jgi:23S rRNA (adenine2503-C2)-methyltransferase